MLVAPLYLALALGQACPAPPGRYGPPPCAAANVPGCLPGYIRDRDEWGRVIYRCDPSYWGTPAPAPAPPSPEPWAGPPPAPPPSIPPPPPAYAPQLAVSQPRGVVGLVFMPGATTTIGNGHTDVHRTYWTGALALELRAPTGGGRLRFGGEWTEFAHLAEVGLKYDFLDQGPVRPFLALAGGAASFDGTPTWRFEGAGSVGLDIYPSRNFFITLEAKRRWFASRDDDLAYGLPAGSLWQTAFFAGMGVYF